MEIYNKDTSNPDNIEVMDHAKRPLSSDAVLGAVPDKSRLIKIAAELLTSVQLSDHVEDYKFKIPKYMLRQIKKQSNRLREIAIELREISDRIK